MPLGSKCGSSRRRKEAESLTLIQLVFTRITPIEKRKFFINAKSLHYTNPIQRLANTNLEQYMSLVRIAVNLMTSISHYLYRCAPTYPRSFVNQRLHATSAPRPTFISS